MAISVLKQRRLKKVVRFYGEKNVEAPPTQCSLCRDRLIRPWIMDRVGWGNCPSQLYYLRTSKSALLVTVKVVCLVWWWQVDFTASIDAWLRQNYPHGCYTFGQIRRHRASLYITNRSKPQHCLDCNALWGTLLGPCWLLSAPCYKVSQCYWRALFITLRYVAEWWRNHIGLHVLLKLRQQTYIWLQS